MYYNMLNNTKKNNKVIIIILTYKNNNFSNKEQFYNFKIFGKSIIDYVINACSYYKTKVINAKSSSNLINLIKPFSKKYDFVAVFYCDTPLLSAECVNTCLDFAILKDINICKLPRGYVFKSEFLKNYSEKEPMQPFNYFENEFLAVTNFAELEKVTNLLQKQINEKFLNLGVKILNSQSVFIDYDVKIEKGVTIYPNNIIKGNTIIKSGVTLYENNVLENCIIEKNSTLKGMNLVNCKVNKNINLLSNNYTFNTIFK